VGLQHGSHRWRPVPLARHPLACPGAARYRLQRPGGLCGQRAVRPASAFHRLGRTAGYSGERIGVAPGAPLHPGESPMAKKTGSTAKATTTGITKQEAVRRAVAALGKTASAKDLQKHVKEAFNLDMTITHIYNAKSNILAKGKKKAQKPKV